MLLSENGYHDVPAGKLAAVTTSLEMFARPALRPEPANAAWELRQVEKPDVAWYRDLYRRVGAGWLWFSRLRMPNDALAAAIQHPAVEVYALVARGNDEGLIELDFREAGVCELRMFGVTPPLIGTGAGRWLMNRAVEATWSRPIRRFWVHTCTFDHPSALQFYIRSGLVPFRRQIEIADDPRLNGTLARDDAPQVPII
jgi:GNAT superfamily N-acetyltransferase